MSDHDAMCVVVDGAVLVFRGVDDCRGPQCVAVRPGGRRCNELLGHDGYEGWDLVNIAGTDGSISVISPPGDYPPECWSRQRCMSHVNGDELDVAPPSGVEFDPARDADLISPNYPLWTPDGIVQAPARAIRLPETALTAGDAEERAPALYPDPEPEPTALYRWYDIGDLLLYTGVSKNLGSRTGSHVRGSSWMDFAVRSTIERLPDRPAALAAEDAAIAAEQPLFNAQGNQSPEARQRLVEYLIKHDRLDLLAPAVARG